MHVLGLMSGTSADGVDAALAQFSGTPSKPNWSLLNLVSTPYPKDLRNAVVQAGQGQRFNSRDWLELSEAITEVQAQAARACDPNAQAELVGCHGQTVWHRPPSKGHRGASWQILQAPLLAEMLQCPVVHDFRSIDLALGGQGAPLVPMADAALLGRVAGWRGVLNLGGISNLTLIPPRNGPDRGSSVLGWDCGPANSLIDLAMHQFSKGKLAFDRDGAMASGGRPHAATIERWLKEPFFQLPPPKSTGREQFGQADLENRLQELPGLPLANFVATLTAFSAAVVAQDLDNLHTKNLVRPLELVVAGGGSRNPVLMSELRQRCRGMRVRLSDELGLRAEAREALAFALLAWWHSLRQPGNAPAITGARNAAVLGVRADPG